MQTTMNYKCLKHGDRAKRETVESSNVSSASHKYNHNCFFFCYFVCVGGGLLLFELSTWFPSAIFAIKITDLAIEMFTHTHTHTHRPKYTYVYKHTHIQTRMYMHSHTRRYTQIHTDIMHTYIHRQR